MILEQNQVGKSKKALYIIALNFLATNAILQIYQSLVPLIMQRDFKVSEWKIGIVTGAVNVVVCVLLLALNKVRRTIGMLVIGGTILSVALALTPLSIKLGNVVLFVALVYVGMMSISYIKVIANDFILCVASPGKENGAMALTKIMSAIGGIIVFLIMYIVNDNCMFWSMVLLNVLTVGGIYCIRGQVCRSKYESDSEVDQKNNSGLVKRSVKALIVILLCYTVYNALVSTFSRYSTIVWNMEDNDFAIYQSICLVTAFIAYFPIGKISNKDNQKRITIIGMVLLIASMISMAALSEFHFVAIISIGLVGVAWATISVNLVPILVCGANEQEVSSLVGFYSIICNVALIVAPVISGFILEYLPYRMLYPLLSAILVVAIFILLMTKNEKSKCE